MAVYKSSVIEPSVQTPSFDQDKELAASLSDDDNEYIDPKIERSLVRKFDLLILPMCGEKNSIFHSKFENI